MKRKILSKMLTIILVFTVLVGFTACDQDTEEKDKDILGVWEITELYDSDENDKYEYPITFDTVEFGTIKLRGYIQITENSLTFYSKWNYSVNGEEVTEVEIDDSATISNIVREENRIEGIDESDYLIYEINGEKMKFTLDDGYMKFKHSSKSKIEGAVKSDKRANSLKDNNELNFDIIKKLKEKILY